VRFPFPWWAELYPDGQPEFNIKTDIPAAEEALCRMGPTHRLVASGYEVGEALRFPAVSIEKDFAWSPRASLGRRLPGIQADAV